MIKIVQILQNPFEMTGEKRLFIYGIIFFIAGIFLAYEFQVQLQILRINPLEELTPVSILLGHGIIVSGLTASYYIYGKLINRKTRFIDILNTVLISIIPVYLLCLQNINNFIRHEAAKVINGLADGQAFQEPSSLFIVTSILSLLVIIYFIYLLFTGFRIATNAKKVWHYIVFFILLFIIDAVCSYLINLL